MENSAVAYENATASTTVRSAGYTSKSSLIFDSNNKAMRTRLVYGAMLVLTVTVLALLVALIVVSVNKSDSDGAGTAGGLGGEVTPESDLPVVDCSYGSTNLEKAKCVLDSYPLVDG